MKTSIPGFNWMKRSDFEKATGQSLRHLFFYRRDELIREGVARKWGKNWMVRPDKLDSFIENGGSSKITR